MRFPAGNKKAVASVVCAAVLMLPHALAAFPFGISDPAGTKEYKQAETAALTGNIKLAEKLYSKAMELGSDDLHLWGNCVLRLGTLALQQEDISGAKAMLEKFRKRIPAGSAGTLPGEIMAAENDLAGAEKEFRALIANKDISSTHARYCLAGVLMRSRRFAEALEIYTSLLKSGEPVGRKAEYARILLLLETGKFTEAEEFIEKALLNGKDRNFEKLRLLCAIKKGDLEFLKKNWKLGEHELLRSDEFMCSLAEAAAELAAKKGEFKFAAERCEEAFAFASKPETKRDIIRKLFDNCAHFDAQTAAQTAEKYSKLFPEASDRALLLIKSGELLTAAGKPQEAVKVFSSVVDEKEFTPEERCSAAFGGAAAAEAAGVWSDVESLFEKCVSLSSSPSSRDEAKLKYAGFFMRRREFARADAILSELAAGERLNSTKELAAYRLLQSKSMQNALSGKELSFAETLSRSENKTYAEFAAFVTAEIFLITGKKSAEVRRKYLDFISAYPESQYVSQSHFQAARLAGKEGNYAAAAKEFVAFADKYPKHPNTGAARFFALDYFCRAGMRAEAEQELKKLSTLSGGDDAFTAGVLTLSEYLLGENKAKEALTLVLDYSSEGKNPQLNSRSDIIFLTARIHFRLGEFDLALSGLDKMEKLSADRTVLAEANLLAGNIRCDIYNDFVSAEKNFLRAHELVKEGVFGSAVAGRLADCRYSIYLQNNDKEVLASAEELYRQIAETAPVADMQVQAMYKAGRCHEAAGDKEKALEDYEETLNFALTLRQSGVVPNQTWCERAAYSAIEIALSDEELTDGSKAEQLLWIYRKLGYENSTRDFKTLQMKVRERQKLLNRGVRY